MNRATLRVQASRLQADFEALSAIGTTGDGGVHRPALSEAHLAARRWLKQRITEAGLEWRQDSAGNLSAFLPCAPSEAPTLLLGSHLDSVPYGGRFDGALGVLAALEVLRVIRETNLSLPFHLEAIDFTDEEGTLVGLLGSRALAGQLTSQDLRAPRGGRQNLTEALRRAGLTEPGLLQAQRDPASLSGYLELHIEQGPILYSQGIQIGVVTAIVGIASYQLTFLGKANHAGTTPMAIRQDAGLGACAFALAARKLVVEAFPDCVMNIGAIELKPGAFNIIPGQATVRLEARAPQASTLRWLEDALLECAKTQAEQQHLKLEIESLGSHPPSAMHPAMQEAIQAAARDLNLTWMPLVSGAGHDAQSLASRCPSGMIFIPSVEGVSHSPHEFSAWEDCLNGANVLLQTVLNLAKIG